MKIKKKKGHFSNGLKVTPGGINEQLKAWIVGKPDPEAMKMMHHVLGYFFGALTQTQVSTGRPTPGVEGFWKGAGLVAEASGQPLVQPWGGSLGAKEEEKLPPSAEEMPQTSEVAA